MQAKQKRKERADPVASAKPDLGPVAAAQKGLSYPGMATSRSFAQHLFKNAVGVPPPPFVLIGHAAPLPPH